MSGDLWGDEVDRVRHDIVVEMIAQALGRSRGYLITRPIDDETIAAVVATIAGGGQILRGGVTEEAGVSDRWTYPSLAAAVCALGAWWLNEWADEPAGWIRHQPSDRRRSYDRDVPTVLVDEWVAP